jgi:pimeloyl-ACP methyl ester carboxylesterase
MAAVADGLAAILEAEGIERAHALGQSLGAAVAHVLVRRHPDKVDKLVLSGFGLYNERSIRLARRALRLFELLPYWCVSGYYKKRMAKILSGIDEGEQAFMQGYVTDLLDVQHTKRTLVGQFRLMRDMYDKLDEYGVFAPVARPGRVLILQAKDDTGFKPDEQAALRETYPGALVHLLEQGGHLAGVTQREEFEAVRTAFLKSPVDVTPGGD